MTIPKSCSHIKLDGQRCRAFALTGKRNCHYHDRYHDRASVPRAKNTYALVPFEDTRSILFTINQLIYSFLNDLIDESKFTKTIYALQVAAQYVNREDALSPDAILEQEELAKAEQEAEEQAEQEQAKQEVEDKAKDDPVCLMIDRLIDAVALLNVEKDTDNQETALNASERDKAPPHPFQKT
jgi:hypothetical protein